MNLTKGRKTWDLYRRYSRFDASLISVRYRIPLKAGGRIVDGVTADIEGALFTEYHKMPRAVY